MNIFTCIGSLGEFEYDADVFTYDRQTQLLKFKNGYKGDVKIPDNILSIQEMFRDCDLSGVHFLECDTSRVLSMVDAFNHTNFGTGFKFPKGFTLANCKLSIRMFDNCTGSIQMNEDCTVNPDIIFNGMFHDSSLLLPSDDEGEPCKIIERLKQSDTPAKSFVEEYDVMKVFEYSVDELDKVKDIDGLLEKLRR